MINELIQAEEVNLSFREAVTYLLGLYSISLLVILFQEIGIGLPPQLSVPVIYLTFLIVPGGLLLLYLYPSIELTAKHWVYSIGCSLLVLIGAGFFLSIGLPYFGIEQPLARNILSITLTVIVGSLGFVVYSKKAKSTLQVRIPPRSSPLFPLLLLIPLLTIIGVGFLNRTGLNTVILGVLVAIALVPITVVLFELPPRWHSLTVFSIAISVLLHKALWQFSGYSGQPYSIRVWNSQRWLPGISQSSELSASLLPNGLLYPILARLTDVHILTQYNVLNPFIVGFIPLALFVAYRAYTRSIVALLGTFVFVFAHPFFRQYPTGGRAATPVLFLALFGMALSDKTSTSFVKTILGLVFLLGIVVSHYGTSYFVMASLWVAVGILFGLKFIDGLIDRFEPAQSHNVANGGQNIKSTTISLVSASLATFFSISTIAWYLYINQGRKFDQLPKHIRDSIIQLIGGRTFTGRTTARITKDYGTEAIQYSKYIYGIIGILLAIGLAYTGLKRVFHRDTRFDDSYIAIASGILAIFGMTIIARNWGGGRPMMITYVFTAVFAVVGMISIGNLISKNRKLIRGSFAVMLAVFFILNSGVASAIILGGFAPSNVPNQAQLYADDSPRAQTLLYKQTDIATHIWFIKHFGGLPFYGDTYANRQTDWYRPQIIAATNGSGWGPIEGKPLGLSGLSDGGVETGYIILLGHNIALNGSWSMQYAPPEASLSQLELSERNVVFTTGISKIYHYKNSSV